MSLLTNLNEIQKQIVTDTEGRILVLSAAGSGKTRCLTHRIAYLIQEGVNPWEILAVTFTNKAANEMSERVVELAGTQARETWIGTFHGICVRMLFRFGKKVGVENFTIIDDKEQKAILKEVIPLCTHHEYEVDVCLSVISDAKNELIPSSQLLLKAEKQHERDLANIYQAYEEKKKESSYLDFDDIIMKTVLLLQEDESARNTYQNQFKYVMVDETQDTNVAQFELLKMLSNKHENLFTVSDVDQSIYRWRGAQISNIINFKETFPNTRVYKMEQNYRSTKTIVEASNSLIENNKERLEKTSFSEIESGDPIRIYRADNDAREADFVRDVIQAGVRRNNMKYEDFAILYRTNRQSRMIETSLRQVGIPYQIVNGHEFFSRKEIKDLVAYLRAIHNPNDALAFERIVNTPKRGLGPTTVNRIKDFANDSDLTFYHALKHIDDVPKVTKGVKKKINDFVDMMEKFYNYRDSDNFTAASLLEFILAETAFKQQYDINKEEDETRLENIDELLKTAAEWDKEEGKTLADFLTETSLTSDIDGMEDEKNRVVLMTTHSSKGLEFDTVFIIGLEEQIFPHVRSFRDERDMEEERRIMYVAMTRAEKRLYLSYCQHRYDFSMKRMKKGKPSRFLFEIPKEHIKMLHN